MRRPRIPAVVLGGAPLLALAMAQAATGRQDLPPPGVPIPPPPPTLAPDRIVPPAPGQAPTPGPVVAPSPAAGSETAEEQERQDRQLAESMRGETRIPPDSVTIAIPSGWVRVAVDLDGDGTFDTVETLHVDDLTQARIVSAQRQRAMSGGPGGEPAEGLAEQGEADRAIEPDHGTIELTGTVREIREFRLAGSPTPHRIARVETDEGTAKVDFGPADALHDLSIDEGDEVTVVGVRGMINDRPVLMARSVSKGDDARDIESPDDGLIKRVRGQVVGTRTVVFRGHDEEHLVTEIELRGGNRAEVILGPKSKLDGLELIEGASIALLVRPARLNGRPAMAAEQIRLEDGDVIPVRDPVTEPVRTEVDPLDGADVDSAGEPIDEPGAEDPLRPTLRGPAPDGGDDDDR